MTDPHQSFLRSRKRGQEIRQRVARVDSFEAVCVLPGCRNPTMKAEGSGLAAFHCKHHVQHKARHGSHWHGTYKAAELAPYRKAAESWLKANAELPVVVGALAALQTLYHTAGPFIPSTSLRGLSAQERAKIAFARFRKAEIPTERLLAVYLAVTALIDEDPGSHRVQEFRIVQAAKAAHRLASGYHRRWEFAGSSGKTLVTELHGYARSTGRVLRFIGAELDRACGAVAASHLGDVLALKVKRYGVHPAKPKVAAEG